jgi:hypothetical protein
MNIEIKKVMKNIAGLFLLIISVVLLNSNQSNAQCSAFTKKKCLPALAPYTHNGQLNSTNLSQGETAELQMTFYSGQNYRLMLCHQPNLVGVYFKLKDGEHKEIYNSKEHDSPQFDFNVKSTQQLFVEVIVPEIKNGAGDLIQSGCVSVLVGFKN